jgi:chromosome segregation ATPase
MNDNTQLPAEVLGEITTKADEKYSGFNHYGACKMGYVAGAVEYATKLHEARQENESLTNQLKHHSGVSDENMKLLRREYAALQDKQQEAEQEIAQLKRWKIEAAELLAPINAYVHKHIEVSLGQCSVKLVLERCKQFEQARTLLEKLASNKHAFILPEHIENEIKTFLDGAK